MKIFAIIFLSLITFLGYFIGSSVIPFLTHSQYIIWALWVIHIGLMGIVLSAPFLSRIESLDKESIWYKTAASSAYYLLGFYFLLLFLIVVKIVTGLFISLNHYETVLSYAFIFASIGLTYLGFIVAKKDPSILAVQIKLADEHKALKGTRIVQMSDIHVSNNIRGSFVDRIVASANNLNPDFVMLTGDIVDGPAALLKSEVEGFRNLKSTYGTYYVPGNHEYYWNVDSWLPILKGLNFNILLNSNLELNINGQKLAVAGVHDLNAHQVHRDYKCDPNTALKTTSDEAFKILLAHQPKTIKLIKEKKANLVLSGHTHAGQFFPASLLIFLFQPYVKGLHKVESTWLYINQGTGYWGPPNRLGTKSEITLIELV